MLYVVLQVQITNYMYSQNNEANSNSITCMRMKREGKENIDAVCCLTGTNDQLHKYMITIYFLHFCCCSIPALPT
jgi:hypothetical protein